MVRVIGRFKYEKSYLRTYPDCPRDTRPIAIHNPILDLIHKNNVNSESDNVYLQGSDSDNQTIETANPRLEPAESLTDEQGISMSHLSDNTGFRKQGTDETSGLYATPFLEVSESKSIEMMQIHESSFMDRTNNESLKRLVTTLSLSPHNECDDNPEGLIPITLYPETRSVLQLQDRLSTAIEK